MFAQKVHSLRMERKMSQLELVKKFNVAQQTVGKWENGLAYVNSQAKCNTWEKYTSHGVL